MHLDVFVADLAATDTLVVRSGATPLQDRGAFRTYADPFGHPFCLYEQPSPAAGAGRPPGVLGRIVIDCDDPSALADSYAGLLGMPRTGEDGPDRVTLAGGDGSGPALAFQRARYVPPRWPDPAYPAQMHLDLSFGDARAARQRAERLGAIRLDGGGEGCPVYADPAGHPFCLWTPGQ